MDVRFGRLGAAIFAALALGTIYVVCTVPIAPGWVAMWPALASVSLAMTAARAFRGRMRADGDGIEVRNWSGVVYLHWNQIDGFEGRYHGLLVHLRNGQEINLYYSSIGDDAVVKELQSLLARFRAGRPVAGCRQCEHGSLS